MIRKWTGVWLLLAVMLSFGCDGLVLRDEAYTRLYDQYALGKKLVQKKKYAQALKAFLTLQSKNPNRLDLMYNLGAVYLKMAESKGAKGELRKKYLDKAEKSLRQVLSKGRASLRQKAHYNLGLLLARKKKYDESLFHFEQAVRIARTTLKKPDPAAQKNRNVIAVLIRQRERKRRELNRTRVFRYEPKVITLTASKKYAKPMQEIALRGEFTHKQTRQKIVVWGYPTSQRRWKIRFVPTRSGKWTYKVRSVVRTTPGTTTKTIVDSRLKDEGLFKVLPSSRPGKLVLAKANRIRFAWKKPKEKLKLKTKKKKGKNSAATASKTPNKGTKAAKGKKKKGNGIPEDEKLILWQSVGVRGLFSKSLSKQRFQAHLTMLRSLAPTALLVDVKLDALLRQTKGQKEPVLNVEAVETLEKRLKAVRKDVTQPWALVLELQSSPRFSQQRLRWFLPYLLARFGHVDVLWSVRFLPPPHRKLAESILKTQDAYKQPIALTHDFAKKDREALINAIREARKRQREALKKKLKALKAKKGKKKGAKQKKTPQSGVTKKKSAPTTRPALPTLKLSRLVRHTHSRVSLGRSLRQVLVHPWLSEIQLPKKVQRKALLNQWWAMFISGLSAGVRIPRPFNDEELKQVQTWLTKANDLNEGDPLPPHPDDVKAKKKTAKKAAKGQKAALASKATKTSKRKVTKATRKSKVTKTGKKKKAPKVYANTFLHWLRVRGLWLRFLGKVRFHEFLRPEMVSLRIPDVAAMRKAQMLKLKQKKAAAKKAVQRAIPARVAPRTAKPGKGLLPLLAPGKKGTSGKGSSYIPLTGAGKPSSRPSLLMAKPTSRPVVARKPAPRKPTRPKTIWKLVQTRGFIVGNGLTTLFMPPGNQGKEPPQINWKNSRRDLEFTWFNAETGKYLDKRLLRLVRSLALTRPKKKKAHIAKVMLKDHKMNQVYPVQVSQKLLKVGANAPLMQPAWTLKVKPPKGLAYTIPVFLGPKGYEARFRPNTPGLWSFTLMKGRKAAPGDEGLPATVKVIPSNLPTNFGLHPRRQQLFAAMGRPMTFMVRRLPAEAMTTWTTQQFADTMKAMQKLDPGTSVLAIPLPTIPWKKTLLKLPSKATSKPTPKLYRYGMTLAAQKALQSIDQRLKAAHNSGFRVAFVLSAKSLGKLSRFEKQQLFFYLLDRYQTSYPLLWFSEEKGKKPQLTTIRRMLRMWYVMRFPTPRPKKGQKKKARRQQPVELPPMLGAIIGNAGSEKRVKSMMKQFDFLWLTTNKLLKDIKDFKLMGLKRPVILSWEPMLKSDFSFKKTVKGKSVFDKALLKRWAAFVWRAHTLGFSHRGPGLTQPMVAPKKKAKVKPVGDALVRSVLRGFFQNVDMSRLLPMLRSVKVKDYQAFGGESKPQGRGKKQSHDIVLWVRRSVRQSLQLTQVANLKKHRYVWVNPLTGESPVQAQLLPAKPDKKKPNKMTVPFRPAVLYIFRRPPRRQNQKGRRRRQKQQQNLSKRQQVRNRLNRLNDDRNDLLKKLMKKQKAPKNLSGKRG